MVRTLASAVRASGGKSSKAAAKSSTSVSGGSRPSSSKSSGSDVGNPAAHRETPTWQKPITNFFTKTEATDSSTATTSKVVKGIKSSTNSNAVPSTSKTFPRENIEVTDNEINTSGEHDGEEIIERQNNTDDEAVASTSSTVFQREINKAEEILFEGKKIKNGFKEDEVISGASSKLVQEENNEIESTQTKDKAKDKINNGSKEDEAVPGISSSMVEEGNNEIENTQVKGNGAKIHKSQDKIKRASKDETVPGASTTTVQKENNEMETKSTQVKDNGAKNLEETKTTHSFQEENIQTKKVNTSKVCSGIRETENVQENTEDSHHIKLGESNENKENQHFNGNADSGQRKKKFISESDEELVTVKKYKIDYKKLEEIEKFAG